MRPSIPHVEDVIVPRDDVLLKSTEEVRIFNGRGVLSMDVFLQDAERVRLMLHFDNTFIRGKEPPTEIFEEALLQALECYKSSKGTSEPRLSNAPEEIGHTDGLQRCLWVDKVTKQICCCESVPAGEKAMLSHLNKEHKVRGSETDVITCQWAVSNSRGVCGKKFQRCNTPRHIAIHLGFNRVICTYCGKGFSRSDSLAEHVRNKHQG